MTDLEKVTEAFDLLHIDYTIETYSDGVSYLCWGEQNEEKFDKNGDYISDW